MLRRMTGLVLPAAVVLLLTAVDGWAMDPRFELDPAVISRAQGGSETRAARLPAKKKKKAPVRKTVQKTTGSPYVQTMQLMRPTTEPFDAVAPLREVWPKLVPAAEAAQPTNLTVAGETFTLSLDALRYPVFTGTDGGKIILDTAGTLSALVGSLMTSRDSSIHIIAEDPGNRRRFVSTLLGAAGFYSVEEGLSLSVGDDPRLKIMADFKIEPTADSLLKREVTLLNLTESGRPLPPVLCDYLWHEGFQLLEPYARADEKAAAGQQGTIYHLAGNNGVALTDSLLQVLALPVKRDHTLQLFNLVQDGLQLDIRADRLFTRRGEQFVVSFFRGDPVSYTLNRLLETKGYKVIVVDAQDDFLKVTTRILDRLGSGESYGVQTLKLPAGSNYSVQVKGVMLSQKQSNGQQVILTTSDFSPLLRELVQYSGFSLVE